MQNIVVPHDPTWADAFENEANAIQARLCSELVSLHHIGSTAIPDIQAKPIIDLLGEVQDLEAINHVSSVLGELRYQGMGSYGIEGRRFYRKEDASGNRTHHLHIFEQGSPHIVRHLAFRDYMITHPDRAAQYSALKLSLAEKCDTTREAYQDGKSSFISQAEADALSWYRQKRQLP